MDAARLKHLEGFDSLPPALLAEAARQVRLLRVPPGRWLVRPGRRLPGRLYLLTGRVRVAGQGVSRRISAPSDAARSPVYPGPAEVVAVLPSELAAVPGSVVDALADGAAVPLPALPRVSEGESWQQRFLASPLMQRLSPVAWQQVLRAMAAHQFEPRDVVLRAGEPAGCCYVLSGGRADILSAAGDHLATLRPGDLFGEDALLSGGHRTATVRLCTAGAAVSLPAACFEAWLVDVVTPPLVDPGARRLLSLDGRGPGRRIAIGSLRAAAGVLPRRAAYAVSGGTWRQRRLAAFLLAERGLDARPLALGAVPAAG